MIMYYKGRKYLKLGKVKVKNPKTREWEENILYANENQSEFFARPEEEFNERFSSGERRIKKPDGFSAEVILFSKGHYDVLDKTDWRMDTVKRFMGIVAGIGPSYYSDDRTIQILTEIMTQFGRVTHDTFAKIYMAYDRCGSTPQTKQNIVEIILSNLCNTRCYNCKNEPEMILPKRSEDIFEEFKKSMTEEVCSVELHQC